MAPGSGDPAKFTLDDVSTQRNLSQQGRDDAREIGNCSDKSWSLGAKEEVKASSTGVLLLICTHETPNDFRDGIGCLWRIF
jgi:hypothetical protein